MIEPASLYDIASHLIDTSKMVEAMLPFPKKMNEAGFSDPILDACKLAQHYLDEHDPTPLSKAMLQHFGFSERDSIDGVFYLMKCCIEIVWIGCEPSPRVVSIDLSTIPRRLRPKTKGQLQRLINDCERTK